MHHAGLGKLWPNVGDRTGRENYAALLRELGREAEAAAMEARAEAIRAGRAEGVEAVEAVEDRPSDDAAAQKVERRGSAR